MVTSLSRLTEKGLPTVSGSDRPFLDENCFARAIALERKRAERSGRLFLLVVLDLTRIATQGNNQYALKRILKLLSLSIRETDIMGWHKANQSLGIIFTDALAETRKTIQRNLLLRINGLLYNGMEFSQFNQLTMSSYVFPEEWYHDIPYRPSAPILYQDTSKQRYGSWFFTVAKRAIDLLGSSIGLVLGAPLFLLIGLLVKASSEGPILFRQLRIGQYGRPFVFLKFRSMYVDDHSDVHRAYATAYIRGLPRDGESDGKGQPVYKIRRDQRITRLGAFLRKTSVDELPQLYHVLRGEMSLVGPRPAIPYEVEAYEPWHRRRVLEAKPGITGLWQVNGRSRVTFDEMVRLDVRYAMKRSIWLDLKILLQTPFAVLRGDGAY